MTTFPAYAANFELYPKDGEAARHLAPLLSSLQRIDFTLRVDDPGVNQGQMASDFDAALERAFLTHGAEPLRLQLPRGGDLFPCWSSEELRPYPRHLESVRIRCPEVQRVPEVRLRNARSPGAHSPVRF